MITNLHWNVLGILVAAALVIESKLIHHNVKREARSNICDSVRNNTNKVQCFCVSDSMEGIVKSGNCYLTEKIDEDDNAWLAFSDIAMAEKLDLTCQRNIVLTYIPKRAIKLLHRLQEIVVKYADLKEIQSYAFANLSNVVDIKVSDNQIRELKFHAFANHKSLRTLTMDKNQIIEINRDVFVKLPSLEKLYLTNNKITTIHDKAFQHLDNLKELELDNNVIFSLNSDSFHGLKNLISLELSENKLQVIGDNTFKHLEKLQSLNLASNKIEMVDEKGFHGLKSLKFLSLTRNKICMFDSKHVFKGLEHLVSLNLKHNHLQSLSQEIIEPFVNNLYKTSSNFEFDENDFPCDCKLEWFLELKNKTSNRQLKLAIENLKCNPDTDLKEKWKKYVENEKANSALEIEAGTQNTGDYEYYDDSQLEGKLFYIDLVDLLNCTKHYVPNKTTKPPITYVTIPKPNQNATRAENHGVLDLSLSETTIGTDSKKDDDKGTFTTSRLGTVSPKPIEHLKDVDRDMASDEAPKDTLKQKSNIKSSVSNKPSSAYRSVNTAIIPILCFLSLNLF